MPTLTLDRFEEHKRYWRLEEVNTLIDEIEDVFSEKVHKNIKTANDYRNVLFPIMGKCFITLREIICLVLYGYPDGALSLARNIYEQFIIINYISNHKNESEFAKLVNNYFINYDLERYKALAFEARRCIQSEKLYNDYMRKIAALKNRVGKELPLGNDYWWSGKVSFFKLEESVWESEKDPLAIRELCYLHVLYKRACASIHANSFGNSVRMGVNPDYVGVDTSPQSKGHDVALYLSLISFLSISSIAFEEFNLEFNSYKSRLSDLAKYYRTIIKETYFHA